jgi:membrane protein implicated in regulation of membrane protease activity
MLTLAYLALAILGGGYIIVAAALGHFADAGGHDAGGEPASGDASYGVDQTGHGHVSASDAAVTPFHFPFFSPLALATLAASFGGYGLIALFGLKVGDGASVVLAAPAAVATAYAITYVAHRIVTSSRGSSQIRLDRIVGATGEVTTPIPANGVGEATVMVGAQRYSAPARDAAGQGLPRGTAIVVQRMAGTTLVVARRDTG